MTTYKLSELRDAIAVCAPCVGKSSSKDVLRNFALRRGSMQAFDGEIHAVFGRFTSGSDLPAPILLPADRFQAIVRELTCETVDISVEDNNLVIAGNDQRFRLPTSNPDAFPFLDLNTGANQDPAIRMDVELFRSAVRRTVHCTDQESTRYQLAGVHFLRSPRGSLLVEATDGRQCTRVVLPASCTTSAFTQALLPVRPLKMAERMLKGSDEVWIKIDRNAAKIIQHSAVIAFSLIEGRLPNIDLVLEQCIDPVCTVELTAGVLLQAVRQAAICSTEESKGVDFTFANRELVLSARTADVGQSRIRIPIESEDAMTVCLDPRYVSDFLGGVDPQSVITMSLSSPDKPVKLRDELQTHVIMPMTRN
jgi:DNA polymerase-3 subunit beta